MYTYKNVKTCCESVILAAIRFSPELFTFKNLNKIELKIAQTQKCPNAMNRFYFSYVSYILSERSSTQVSVYNMTAFI